MHRENGGTVRGQRSRRATAVARLRAASAGAAALSLEALEARRLMCFAHDGQSDGIAMSTIGFPPMAPSSGDVTSEPAAAAPGMPNLHSRPGAPAAIFLDFDGDSATGTDPYSEDADATTFNPTEAANITEAWHEMSTYYGMFDVDVTTTQPAAGFPTAWVAIGNNIDNGYSYVNVFPNNGKANSWNNSSHARTRVSGIAHEIGHNFGLQHQADWSNLGVLVNEYSSGYDALHGPIMGVDFAQSVHKWTIGHPSNSATTLQDDLPRIASEIKPYQPPGGDGFRADDFGDTIATATALSLTGSEMTTSGWIERMNDVDAFSFTIDGPFGIAAVPHGVSGVDLKLAVYAGDGTLLALRDSATTNYQDMGLALEPGTYYALLSSHGNYGDVGQYDLALRPLPDGWGTQDVGTHALKPGSAAHDPTTDRFTLTSSGSTYDNNRFAYQVLTGDGSVTARVESLGGATSTRAAGVMLRESLLPTSPFLWAHARGSSGSGWSYRTSSGAGVSTPSGTTLITAPYWLRITRAGSQVTAAKSLDGVNWTNLQTLTMTTGPVYIGLAASSFSSSTTATAVMSNVALTGDLNAPPAYNALPTPAGVSVAPQASGTGLTVTWDDVADESGYLVERSSDGATWTSAGTTAAGDTSFDDNGLPGSFRYFYRVSARDAAAGRSAPSAVAHGVNRPSAVTNVKAMSINASTVVIDWRDTDGETGYRVQRSADGGATWTTVAAALAANVPSYTSSGLVQGTTYQFRITPLSATGDGAASTIPTQTRLNAVGGLTQTGVGSNQVKLAWNGGVPYAGGYKVYRSTNGTTFTLLTTLGNVAAYTDTTVTPLNKYYYRVAAYNSFTESLTGSTLNVATPSATPPPVGWNSINIGNVGAGASGMSGSSATVIGSGAIASGHQFLFRQTNGDGEIIARIATLDGTTTSMTGGLMFRSSLATGASYVYLQASSSNVRITASGGTFTGQVSGSDPVPVWLKLVRSGTSLTGYFSPDGVTWTSVGTSNNALPTGPLYVGLIVTPQNSTAMLKGTFTNIGGSALNVADTIAPSAPAFTSISTDTGSAGNDRVTSDNTLVLNGVAEPASWVTITRAGVGAIATVQANYLGNFSFDYTDAPLPDGIHTFTATAKDGSNNVSPPTANFAVTVDRTPPAPAPGGWTFNPATQRVEIAFPEALVPGSVGSGDVTLLNLTTGQSVAASQWSYLAATQTATYGTGATLADGHWRATLASASVLDAAGNAVAEPHTFEFYYASGTSGGDSFEVRLAPGGTGSIEITDGTVTHTVPRAEVGLIVLDPLGGDDAVHLDFSTGADWMPPHGLGIGAAESLRVSGPSTGQAFTFAGNVLSSAGWSVDVTAVQSLALSGGRFTLASDLGGRALNLDAGADASATATLRLATLAITAGAALNLNDNDLVVRSTPLADIEALIAAKSLTSALFDGSELTALASATADVIYEFAGPGDTALFSGQTVFAGDVLVKYTYGGDSNLDGKLDADDYGTIDFYVLIPGSSGYYNGDFNRDGKIDADDYGIIDFNILAQGDPL